MFDNFMDKLKEDLIKITVSRNGETFELERDADYSCKLTKMTEKIKTYTYRINKKVFDADGASRVFLTSEDESGNASFNEAKGALISFYIDSTEPLIISYATDDVSKGELRIRDNISLDNVEIYIGDEKIEYETIGEIYSFDIPADCKETDVKVVASDSAGNVSERVLNDYIVTRAAKAREKSTSLPLLAAAPGLVTAAVVAIRRFNKKGRRSA